MKRLRNVTLIAVAALLVLGALGSTGAIAQETSKVRVAVIGFENNSTWTWWGDRLGYAAADELVTQLVQTGKFSVVERSQLQAIMEEQNLGQSGRVNASTAAEIGKILGVQVMVTGSITQFSIERISGGFAGIGGSYSRAESMMDVRLINTETAEIMAVAEGEGNKRFGGGFFKGAGAEREFDAGVAQESLRPAVKDVTDQIVEQADRLASIKPSPGAGNVVGSPNDTTVYIDRGDNFGVETGQRFAVYRVVDEITDSQGNVLDRVTERVGTIEVTKVMSQSAICRVVDGEAAEGDTFRSEG